ncbi:TIGR02677 family protein [Cohnella sp. GCM10012308]|uniref:TIGR02677 family protein n=1 Tax=Cohnella sp. GCM10012308 TaxID=3317329 RepID=UPI003606BEF1
MDLSLIREIKEAAYLSTKKTHRYRPILRYMYEQHRIFNNDVLPIEIFTHLKQFPEFGDYTLEEQDADLAVLVENNNLVLNQNNTDAVTLEELVKNRKTYSLTDYTIEFEKMLIFMEKRLHRIRGGSLDKNLTERLHHALMKLNGFSVQTDLDATTLVQLYEAWDELFERFTKLDNDASDYLNHISGDKLDSKMETGAFIVFKNQFRSYLTDFMVELNRNSPAIIDIITRISEKKIQNIILQLVRYKKNIPTTTVVSDKEYFDTFFDVWTGIRNWFLASDTKPSKAFHLEVRTRDAISKMSKLAHFHAERQFVKKSRVTEFLRLADMAYESGNLEEAHKVFSYLFGFEGIQHFKVARKPSDRNDGTVWDFDPDEIDVTYRIRPPSDRTIKQNLKVSKVSQESLELQRLFEERLAYEESVLKTLVEQPCVVLKDLDKGVEPFVRKALLDWISAALLNPVGYGIYEGTTELGVKFKLHRISNDIIELHCSDGILFLPDFEMTFTEVKTREKAVEGVT